MVSAARFGREARMPVRFSFRAAALLAGALAILVYASERGLSQQHAAPLDEAQASGRNEVSFPHAKEDYFRAMDNGVPLSEDEVQGRNMWLVWTGGNDR